MPGESEPRLGNGPTEALGALATGHEVVGDEKSVGSSEVRECAELRDGAFDRLCCLPVAPVGFAVTEGAAELASTSMLNTEHTPRVDVEVLRYRHQVVRRVGQLVHWIPGDRPAIQCDPAGRAVRDVYEISLSGGSA